MFYHLTLTKELEIPPRHFGPKLRSVIEEKLKGEVRAHLKDAYTQAAAFVLAEF
jgi:DNA-directed RNA polymerase subunit E'/Rpb7